MELNSSFMHSRRPGLRRIGHCCRQQTLAKAALPSVRAHLHNSLLYLCLTRYGYPADQEVDLGPNRWVWRRPEPGGGTCRPGIRINLDLVTIVFGCAKAAACTTTLVMSLCQRDPCCPCTYIHFPPTVFDLSAPCNTISELLCTVPYSAAILLELSFSSRPSSVVGNFHCLP